MSSSAKGTRFPKRLCSDLFVVRVGHGDLVEVFEMKIIQWTGIKSERYEHMISDQIGGFVDLDSYPFKIYFGPFDFNFEFWK